MELEDYDEVSFKGALSMFVCMKSEEDSKDLIAQYKQKQSGEKR